MKYISTLAAGYSKRLCIGIVAVCSIVGRSDAATFHGLGTLPGGNYSFGVALSGDGKVAVGNTIVPAGTSFERHSFRWTETSGMQTLSPINNTNMYYTFRDEAHGVSSDGSLVVGMLSDTPNVYVWNQASGCQPLPNGGGDPCVDTTFNYGISSDGSMIVGDRTPNCYLTHSVCWSNRNGPFPLFDDGGRQSVAVAVSDDGLIVTGAISQTTYRWTAASGVQLLTNSVFQGDVPFGMSRDGNVIVGIAYNGTHQEMYRWTARTGLVGLGLASGDSCSQGFGVSNDGNTVVGGSAGSEPSTDPDTNDALIWRPQWGVRHLQDVLTNDYQLDLTGWHLTSARAVSTNGTVILGNGINPSGQKEAWIATIDLSGATPGQIAVYKVGAAYTQIGGYKVERPTVSGYMLMDLSSNNIVFIRTDAVKKTFHASTPILSVARINVSATRTDTAIKFHSDDMVSATAQGQNVNVAINYDSSTHPVNMAIPIRFTVGGFDILTSSTGEAVTRGYHGAIVLDRAATLFANKKGYDISTCSAVLQAALVKGGYKAIP